MRATPRPRLQPRDEVGLMRAPTSPQAETWRPVPRYDGLYEVSDLGRVRSLDRVIEVTSSRATYVIRRRGQMLRLYADRNGHILVNMCVGGRNAQAAVHALVLEAFVGPRPLGHVALPLDEDLGNCRLANLRWATLDDVHARKLRRGTHRQGESHPHAKLTSAAVAAIRADAGTPSRELAARYGVSANRIRAVRSGADWAGAR